MAAKKMCDEVNLLGSATTSSVAHLWNHVLDPVLEVLEQVSADLLDPSCLDKQVRDIALAYLQQMEVKGFIVLDAEFTYSR